jgi:hypothetical protein
MGESNLSDGGGGLTFVQTQTSFGQSELTPSERDCTGGNEDNLLTPLAHAQ